MGIISKVISTVRKIDGIYTMMEDAVKKIDEVYIFVEGKRHLVFPESTLIFEKTTPGAYEFTVPEKYNYVAIEYAGAGGGNGSGGDGTYVAKGRGGVLKIQKTKIENFTINGIVASVGGTPNGGTGYNNGQDGTSYESRGGGGGGSTSVVFNNKTYVASGGAGESRAGGPLGAFGGKGGNGGGPYAGKYNKADTVDATDPGKIGLNSGDGYVRIYGIAG